MGHFVFHSITNKFTYFLPKFQGNLHLCLAGDFYGLALVYPAGPETWPFKQTGSLAPFLLLPFPPISPGQKVKAKTNEVEEASVQ